MSKVPSNPRNSINASENVRRNSGKGRQADAQVTSTSLKPTNEQSLATPRSLRSRFSSSAASDASSLNMSRQDSIQGRDRRKSSSSASSNNVRARGTSHGSAKSADSTKSNSVSNPITVCIRVRPALKHEDRMGDCVTCAADGKTVLLESDGRSKTVTVDIVIDSRTDAGLQESVFDQVGRSLVISAMRDYNVCIFAYGHTGSGKTHTMLGHGEVHGAGAGLLPRFLREIFKEHAQIPKTPSPFYSCEFYEVYNETIRDLLAPVHVTGRDRKREVRVHPTYGVRIEGLSTSVVKNTEEILDLVEFGNKMRTIAATTMNAQSSRSHAIFTFRYLIETENDHHESAMTFVDLAGREDQAASQNRDVQYREMTYINTSLFHLSHLIAKLSEGCVQKGSLSDFRNSKLTLLLYQALTGNSCTALIATVAPSKIYLEDSISTLNFAQQVKRIKTKPIVNTKKSQYVVRDLEKEIATLRKELTVAKTSNTEVEQLLLAANAMLNHFKAGRALDQTSSAEASQMRRRVSVQFGLQCRNAASGEPLPFLTKLSDDSALQGCCNFFLVKERTCLGSVRQGCDICITGVGIRPLMCNVIVHDDKSIAIELVVSSEASRALKSGAREPEEEDDSSVSSSSSDQSEFWSDDRDEDEEPRVLVNGRRLHSKDRLQLLQHGDAIVLGYSHAFRLVIPSVDDVGSDAATIARQKLDNMSLSSAMQENEEEGPKLQTLYPCLQQLSLSSSEGSVRSLLKALKAVRPMVDEANSFTREILGTGRLSFQLHIVTDWCSSENAKPQIVICVLGYQPSVNTSIAQGRKSVVLSYGLPFNLAVADAHQLLYIWTLETFKTRLNEMRELYSSRPCGHDGFGIVRKMLQANPFANPWRETPFVDGKALSESSRKPASKFASSPPTCATSKQSKSRKVTVSLQGLDDLEVDETIVASEPILQNQSCDIGKPGHEGKAIVAGHGHDLVDVNESQKLKERELNESPRVAQRSDVKECEAEMVAEKDVREQKFIDSPEVQKLRAEITNSTRYLRCKGDGLPRLLERLEGVIEQLSREPLSKPQR